MHSPQTHLLVEFCVWHQSLCGCPICHFDCFSKLDAMHLGCFLLKEISHLVAAMVTISERIQAQYLEEKPVTIPQDLLSEFQGQKYLKFSPTSYPIVQLVCGGQMLRNASLAQCPNLTKLLEARNNAILSSIGMATDDPAAENLFDEPEENIPKTTKVAKKRKLSSTEEESQQFAATIQVESQEVQSLAPIFRPTRSSLQVCLTPAALEATIRFLRTSAKEGLERPTGAYTQKKK